MRYSWVIVLSLALTSGVVATTSASEKNETQLRVKNSARAEFNWMMNCQGCHGVKGLGSPNGAPPMPGTVARFLTVDGGREYLAKVPGVANAPLTDEELSDVLNWMLLQFSCDALPAGFTGYGAHEVGELRKDVLITNAHQIRAELIRKLGATPSEIDKLDADDACSNIEM